MSDDSAKNALSSSAGFLDHQYKRADADVFERVIYCALPVIWLSDKVFPANATPTGQITVEPTHNLTVYADNVIVCGKLSLPSRNLKIVARKLIFTGEASVVTDGKKGENPLVTKANPPPPRAKDGKDARPNVPSEAGTPGFTAAEQKDGKPVVADGADGEAGSGAGNIEIDVEKWVGDATISARGGDGARGQDGQDGQNGGDGGARANWEEASLFLRDLKDHPPSSHVKKTLPPSGGGRGGDAGHGGTGGAGGNGGTITLRWVRAVRTECPQPGGCFGTLKCSECAKCKASGEPTMKCDASGGKRGGGGTDGVPGIGGRSGYDKGTPPMEHTLQGPGVRENDVVEIKGEDPRLGDQNLLGAFGDGTYYHSMYDVDKQRWRINRVEPAKPGEPIRYGDRVRLTNISYDKNLFRYWDSYDSKYITVASESDHWGFVSAADPNSRNEIRPNERLFLQASDGRVLVAPASKTYWYGTIDEADIRSRAASGTLRDKPADKKLPATGNSPLVKQRQIEAAALCRCWHPSQTWLVVERLKGLYLTAEIEGPLFKDLGEELLRWQDLLSPLADGDPEQGADPPALSADSRHGLEDASAKLNGMIGTFVMNLDYFHNKRDFAPNVTFNRYAIALKDTLERLKTFEQRYNTLLDEIIKQDKKKDKASVVFESAVATVSAATDRLGELRDQLDQSAALIQSRSATVDRLTERFRSSGGDFETFRNEVNSNSNFCDLKNILDGLEMMLFAPPVQKGAEGASEMSGVGLAMAGVQLAKFIEHGLATIKTAAGKEVQKADVISSVTELQDALFDKDPFGSAKQVYSDAGGLKHDGGARILATLDKLDKLVEQFANLKSAKNIQYDIRALGDAVRARGDAVVDFNVKLMQALMLQKMIADADTQRVAALQASAELDNPALPAMVSFLTRQYQYEKDATIEQIYLANRAAAFWLLDDGQKHEANGKIVSPINVFRDVLVDKGAWKDEDGGDMYGAIGADVLAACRDKLQDAFLNGLAMHSGVSQSFGSDDADGAQMAGEQIIITDKNKLAEFSEKQSTAEGKAYHRVAFRISREGKSGTFTGGHLKLYANIHLTKFRVFLNGVRADQWIHVRFQHDSGDVYYDENGASRTFSRRNLDLRTFAYDGSKDAMRYDIDPDTKKPTGKFKRGYIYIDGDIGSGGTPQEMARDDEHAIYVGVGPFSEWTLTVPLDVNPGLDLTGLSSIEIQLSGIFRTSKTLLAAHDAPANVRHARR